MLGNDTPPLTHADTPLSKQRHYHIKQIDRKKLTQAFILAWCIQERTSSETLIVSRNQLCINISRFLYDV